MGVREIYIFRIASFSIARHLIWAYIYKTTDHCFPYTVNTLNQFSCVCKLVSSNLAMLPEFNVITMLSGVTTS